MFLFRPFRLLRRLLKFAMGAAIAWVAGFVVFLFSIPAMPDSSSPSADAIIVLTGGGDRLGAGYDLLQSGKGKRLLISGVNPATGAADVQRVLEAETGKPVPMSVLQCCITLGYEAQDTAGNAAEAAAWVRNQHIQSFYLVTADYHMPRSVMEFHRRLPDALILRYPVRPPATTRSSWLAKDTLTLLIGEYHKYLAAWLRGSS